MDLIWEINKKEYKLIYKKYLKKMNKIMVNHMKVYTKKINLNNIKIKI